MLGSLGNVQGAPSGHLRGYVGSGRAEAFCKQLKVFRSTGIIALAEGHDCPRDEVATR